MRMIRRLAQPTEVRDEISTFLADRAEVAFKAKQRLKSMDTDALYEWVDTQVSGVGKAVSDMRRGDAPEWANPAEDALLGSWTLALGIEELVQRAVREPAGGEPRP